MHYFFKMPKVCHYNLVGSNLPETHVEFQLGMWIFVLLENLKVKWYSSSSEDISSCLLLVLVMSKYVYQRVHIEHFLLYIKNLYSIKLWYSQHTLGSDRIIFYPQSQWFALRMCTEGLLQYQQLVTCSLACVSITKSLVIIAIFPSVFFIKCF